MIRAAFLFVFGFFTACTAMAAQTFSCGAADVSINVIGRESAAWENRMESVLTVSRNGYSTVLRYRSIDFIGGECVSVPNSSPLVVFQAYCGGSGCKDGANWGVIETETLKVLTVPSDLNRAETEKILGNQPLPRLKMMNVLREAQALGIQVPMENLRSGPVDFQKYSIVRDKKPAIEYYVSKTKELSPLVLFIQGSGCTPVFLRNGASTVYNFVPIASKHQLAMMVVNKPLTTEKPDPNTVNHCSPAFNAYFTAESWMDDIRAALNQARKLPWVDSRKILVFGFSEGATIASSLAAADKNITHLALAGATGPSQFYDFVVNAYRESANDEEAKTKLDELDTIRRKIAASPDSSVDFAWGHPYKRWTSFFRTSSTQNLLKTDARIYLVSGMRDTNVPILSTESMAAELINAGRDLTLRRVPNANHALIPTGGKWSDSDGEYDRVIDWFVK